MLRDDGLYEEVTATAIKRTLVMQIEQAMAANTVFRPEMIRRMKTSASQLARLLDPDNNASSSIRLSAPPRR